MSLLQQLFKRLNYQPGERNHQSEPRAALKDLLFDWFSAADLSIGDFLTNYFDPYLVTLGEAENFKNWRLSRLGQTFEDAYFDLFAMQFLAAQYPNDHFFRQLFQILCTHDDQLLGYRYDLTTPLRKIMETGPNELTQISKLGGARLGVFYQTSKFAPTNSLSYLVDTLGQLTGVADREIFQDAVTYFLSRDFPEKFSVICFCLEREPYHEAARDPESVQWLRDRRNELIQVFNQRFGTSILGNTLDGYTEHIGHLSSTDLLVKNSDYRQRNRLGLKDFSSIKSFVEGERKRGNDFLILYAYLSVRNAHLGQFPKVHRDIAKLLTQKTSFEPDYFRKLLNMETPLNTEFHIKDTLTPVFKNTERAEEIGVEFDGYLSDLPIYQMSAYKKSFQLIGKTMADAHAGLLSKMYAEKYAGNYFRVFPDGSTRLQIEGRKNVEAFVHRICQKISNFLPAASLGKVQNYQYFEHDFPIAKINLAGTEVTLTNNFVAELNAIFQSHQSGYRIAPIPIRFYEDRHYGEHYRCSLFLLNYAEFVEFRDTYLKRYFPDFAKNPIVTDMVYDNLNAPILRDATEDSQPGFSNDPAWAWFREDHLQKLNGYESWFPIFDQLLADKGVSKPKKAWQTEMEARIAGFGRARFYRELGSMLEGSLGEEFWFTEANRSVVRGIIWACAAEPSEASLGIVAQIVRAAYTKIYGLGARSVAVGNLGLRALAQSGAPEAYGLLGLMRNRTKYNTFVRALEKAMTEFTKNSDLDAELLADQTVPRYDFSGTDKTRRIDDNLTVIFRIAERRLTKVWVESGVESRKAPARIKTELRATDREISAEFKRINETFKSLRDRVKSYWLNHRSWTFQDWERYLKTHPLLAPWLENMIWRNETRGVDFILRSDRLLDHDGEPVTCIPTDQIRLWHPVGAAPEALDEWQAYLFAHQLDQPLRQVYRENYPFSERENALSESPRFAHHFLLVNKLMAIANGAGWIFTYSHEGNSWPRRYLRALNLTVHLRSDYRSSDLVVPTKNFFFTRGDTTKIEYNNQFTPIPFEQIPVSTKSELCRDVDLFIATSSIAHDPELSLATEQQRYYRETFSMSKFSENASAKVRRRIIEQIGPKLGVEPKFAGNFLLVDGPDQSYRINLGSGFAQIADSQRHLNLLPDIKPMKRSKKVHSPLQDDETLYIILAKTLHLKKNGTMAST